MEEEGSAFASFICSVLPNPSGHPSVLDSLKILGVEELEDMYVQEEDLHVLRPVEAWKLIHVKSMLLKILTQHQEVFLVAPRHPAVRIFPTQGRCNAESTSSPQASSSTSACSTRSRQTTVDNNWHFSFEIPWNRMPSEVTRKLDKKERPTGRDVMLFA
ncbi:hypothetical protein DPEC_G00107680 [Dallia pectoralis]|uniref:Uncharacterized protein n=1 Tax=Dallia pectoralis TaxID=75939 RepID=A0ACC2GRV9_DALPE|nr:hypothetical protein DPEC_G00107680 [Dallia pectoralis]